MTELAAVLWDLDGTLIDSEPLWMAAEHALAAQHGAEWTHEDGLALVGNALPTAGAYIKDRLGLDWSVDEVVEHLTTRVSRELRDGEDLPWRPGALDLMASLHAAGVRQALVTMSYATIAEAVVDRLHVEVVVTGDMVEQGKPHPEPYRRAAELLGVDARDCVAIEDSPSGVRSASAAGCAVLAVPHMVPLPEVERRVTRESLVGLDVSGLRDLAATV